MTEPWTYESRGEWEFRHRRIDRDGCMAFTAEARRGSWVERDAVNCLDEPFDVTCYFQYAPTRDEALRKLSKEVLS